MSRTFAHAESASASFAGVLEQLTERAGRGPAREYAESQAGVRSESQHGRQGSPSKSNAASRVPPKAGSAAAAKAPVEIEAALGLDTFSNSTASKIASKVLTPSQLRSAIGTQNQPSAPPAVGTGKQKAASDVAQLSYEAALRLHSRRRYTPPDESVFALPVRTGAGASPAAANAAQKASVKRAAKGEISVDIPAKPCMEPERQDKTRARAKAGKALQPSEIGTQAVRPRGKSRSSAPVAAQTARPTARTAPVEMSDPAAKGKRATKPAPVSARLAAEKAVESVRLASERKPAPSLEPSSKANERALVQVGPLAQLDTLEELAQRKTIVSLRLNDSELDRLKMRAAESGISVSAYMRSCVLEAEHLRAQVKQALAEMRASAMGPGPAQLAGVSEPAAGGGAIWSRLLYRSATFLLGPWLAFRSSR